MLMFRIVAAQLSDNGTYFCMAKNPLGSQFTETDLIVQGSYLYCY
jgi:Immunoglobulin I-set domain